MANAGHGIRDFLSNFRDEDFARSNRFEIHFSLPEIMATHQTSQGDSKKIVSLLAEDVTFPGLLVGTRPIRLNNLNEQRANNIDFGGDSLTISFLIDGAWTPKDMFGDWMRKIIDPVSRYVEYPRNYYGSIDIYALNTKDDVVVHWQVLDVFPRSIAPIQASSTNAQVLRLPVTFAYRKWRVIGGYDPEGNSLLY